MIRLRIAHLFRSLANRLDPPGFQYRVDFHPRGGQVHDWSKIGDDLRFLMHRPKSSE